MRLNVEILGDDQTSSQVLYEPVEAGHLDGLMLVYDEDADEVDAVAAQPEAFIKETPGGRPERWVRVALADVDEPLELPATRMQLIVYGADPNDLRPMLDSDLLTFAQEALAYNGLCSHLVDDVEEPVDEQGEVPVYCGLPSDPDSDYRFCTAHDQARVDQSARLAGRFFSPTYGPIPAPAS